MPFGLYNSPSVFGRYIDVMFRDLVISGTMLSSIDDFIIASENFTQGNVRLIMVLEIGAEHGVELKWKKYDFLQRRVEILGYVIENGAIRLGYFKTKDVQIYPELKTLKDKESFLCQTGYFVGLSQIIFSNSKAVE